MKIAIEATGCDGGFNPIFEGSRMALDRDEDLELILVAGKDKIPEHFFEVPGRISLVLADYTYPLPEGQEKSHKDDVSSIEKAVQIHKEGSVDAIIGPGDTKGTVLYSSKILRRIPGVFFPGIAAPLPYNNVLIDAGATPQCKPKHLLQFAIMGRVYSENHFGVEDPLVGLLSVGKEKGKGPEFIQEAQGMIERLRDKEYNISSEYFEGTSLKDLYGKLVIVTNGYAGNVCLKVAETALKMPYKVLREEIKKQDLFHRVLSYIGLFVAHSLMRRPIDNLKQNFDWKKYAVAPLLGLQGNVMISHGRSDAKSIANAISSTQTYLRTDINSKIEEEISRLS